ncbi:MAG TPA: hypothetical protein PKY77_03285 [Phycisphaerae bacterium]|nr:hypothetical protein [Phycisphaerae bacterium]HRY67377.1 hypothetical protein [Phycisphaerae bacterium]HSA29331.1 hypothetical protein [Phycisphaerae bacterium]
MSGFCLAVEGGAGRRDDGGRQSHQTLEGMDIEAMRGLFPITWRWAIPNHAAVVPLSRRQKEHRVVLVLGSEVLRASAHFHNTHEEIGGLIEVLPGH